MIHAALIAALAFLPYACAADVGDACDKSGDTAGCVDGAICTNLKGGDNVCRKQCTSSDECAANEACNGVSGANIKSCQPK